MFQVVRFIHFAVYLIFTRAPVTLASARDCRNLMTRSIICTFLEIQFFRHLHVVTFTSSGKGNVYLVNAKHDILLSFLRDDCRAQEANASVAVKVGTR